MTSSEATQLSAGAKQRVAARVGRVLDGGDARFSLRLGFACAEFNGGITERLLNGALDAIEELGGDLLDAIVAWAPGAFELPVLAQRMIASGSVDAVVCLGAVIRGETGHYDFVAGQCAAGIQRVQLDTGRPVVFGVLTTDTVEQALARSQPDADNKGREAVLTAAQTATVLDTIGGAQTPAVGFAGRRP